MGFVRVKDIKGKRYAYFVENTWKKRKGAARQKVGAYLGKVIPLEAAGMPAYDPSLAEKKKREMLQELVRGELLARGFREEKGIVMRDGLRFSLQRFLFLKEDGREERAVLEMNEGFLCKHTLRHLLHLRVRDKGDADERETGIALAKAFLEAGLRVPKEAFVAYFEKI